MYEVEFFDGDYRARQRKANDWGADLYVEHHFNSAGPPSTAEYPCVIVANNASDKSKSMAMSYLIKLVDIFTYRPADIERLNDKVIVGGFGGRGNYNLRYTHMPAILLEPMFISHPLWASAAVKYENQIKLAQCLVNTIKQEFPDNVTMSNMVKIAFSIGHKGKTSKPGDRGAAVKGFPGITEASLAERVLKIAEEILEGTFKPVKEEGVEKIKIEHEDYISFEDDVIFQDIVKRGIFGDPEKIAIDPDAPITNREVAMIIHRILDGGF